MFDRLAYFRVLASPIRNAIPKIGDELEQSIFAKLREAGTDMALHLTAGSSATINYSRKVGYFLQVLDFVPSVLGGNGAQRPPSEFKTIAFSSRAKARAALASLNSSLFYWFITVLSDCRHLNKREVEGFPLIAGLISFEFAVRVDKAATRLMSDLRDKSETRVMKFQHDVLTVQCLLPKKSWSAIEEIDAIMAEALRLTPNEADYVASYDIRYRLGGRGEAADD